MATAPLSFGVPNKSPPTWQERERERDRDSFCQVSADAQRTTGARRGNRPGSGVDEMMLMWVSENVDPLLVGIYV